MTENLIARLLTACPPGERGRRWGDFYFARSLATSLQKLGVQSRVMARNGATLLQTGPEGGAADDEALEFDLWIKGQQPINKGENPSYAWLLYGTRTLDLAELQNLHHVFVASEPFAKRLAGDGLSASALLQCTDATLFSPDPQESDPDYDALFVGNQYARRMPRKIVFDLVAAGVPLSVWGRGDWSEEIMSKAHKGKHIENAALGAHYRGAKVVVNDHKREMLENGFLSNRAFDVLASGTAFVTEEMIGIPSDIRAHLYLYQPDQAVDVTKLALDEWGMNRDDLARTVLKNHSFDARARGLLDRVKSDLF